MFGGPMYESLDWLLEPLPCCTMLRRAHPHHSFRAVSPSMYWGQTSQLVGIALSRGVGSRRICRGVSTLWNTSVKSRIGFESEGWTRSRASP
ncbi:hypothetical protein PI124_g18670 [Phytophthora idaei]|nr:hypothetical protein PI125_g19526 [Phytophthora idaei]KAG3236320.1 hypothetical protein PI124_g18670 [Phytophthora idaei]